MKGMVFTEFIEFVEDNFGFETSDYIITESNLKSNGVYTSVGTYDFHEMVSLLINLEKKTEIPINQLLETFGSHLFFRFVALFPQFIDKEKSFYDFVSEIDNYIHIEVKKLYPDAELPRLIILEKNDNKMLVAYTSHRKLSMFAYGLFKSAAEFFKEDVSISMENINKEGSVVHFTFNKK